jgi:hypothetical protein
VTRPQRRALLGLAMVAALLVAWRLLRRPPAGVTVLAERPPTDLRWGSRPGALGPGPFREPPPAPVGAPPIIDRILVEKPAICEGEENLITVEAHAANRTDDPHLHYLVAGQPGARVVVRGSASPRALTDAKVIVFGRDRTTTTADLPAFVVKPCQVDHVLLLLRRALPNRDAEYELTARVDPLGARAPFQAVRYEWDFGDGARSTTAAPVETHDYSHRPQDRLRAEFLVSVIAVSASGARVQGRTTLELLNPSFESLAVKGLVKIYGELEPRFPDPAGTRQRLRLWHPHSAAVTIERLRRLELRRDGPPAPAREVPTAALGVVRIAPGQTVEVDASRLEGPSAADVGIEYYVEGETDDGFRAAGNFALMRPPPPPTPQAHVPVRDPMMVARILRARALLGRPYVTDEDLWRLEREGAMKDLAAPDGGVPLPPAPGVLPKPLRRADPALPP